jgi:sigma-B regulation protein RsbU (phosphoserine phosphatase)
LENQKTLLVIEDDLPFRRSIATYLEDSGYRVIVAAEGEEGTRLFQREKPDLVLTDLRMPVLDGLGFISWLKAISPRTPVLVITGTGDQKAIASALDLGAHQCILKPITDLKMLEKAITRLLSRESPMPAPLAQQEDENGVM